MQPKVLLCQFDALEYYSYMILSARLARAGIKHEVEIIQDQGRFLKNLSDIYKDHDIIAFYTCNADFSRIMRIASRIKSEYPGRTIVLGGPHPTLNPETIDFKIIDFICIGAGEFHFTEWILEGHYKEKKNFHNFICDPARHYEIKFCTDLDAWKINRAVYYDKFPFMRTMGVRRFLLSSGCPYRCTYCHNISFRTRFKDLYPKNVLFVSPEKAIAEMKETLRKYPAEAVSFSDDNLCINREWISSFLEAYEREIRLPFNMSTSATNLTDELIDRLHSSGLKIIRIAMETTNESIRQGLLHRPPYSNEQFKKICRKLRACRVKVVMLNMFCIPTQSLEDCADAFRFAVQNRLVMNVNIFVPYRGTEIFELCVKRGLITPGMEEGDLYSSGSMLKGEEFERMVTLQNYTFILNYFLSLLPVITYLSRFKSFRKFSFKFISPLNIAVMALFQYTGLFSIKKTVLLGLHSFSSFKRK